MVRSKYSGMNHEMVLVFFFRSWVIHMALHLNHVTAAGTSDNKTIPKTSIRLAFCHREMTCYLLNHQHSPSLGSFHNGLVSKWSEWTWVPVCICVSD